MDTRELFARLIQCEAGGEGTDGMMGVATVVMNRATINYGEFARINGGGDIRSVIEQPGQFTCMKTSVGGVYNPQNVYNMIPLEEHYAIADWAIAGGRLPEDWNGVVKGIKLRGGKILYAKIENGKLLPF